MKLTTVYPIIAYMYRISLYYDGYKVGIGNDTNTVTCHITPHFTLNSYSSIIAVLKVKSLV